MLNRLLAIFFLTCGCAWGQASPPAAYTPQLITFNGTPFGNCQIYQIALNTSNGAISWCNNNAWQNAPIFSSGIVSPTIGPSAAQQHTLPAVSSDTFALLGATQTFSGPKTFGQQITSTVSTGTAPFSIASTTQVTNLNAQLHGGFSAPASAIVGISDSQTLTNKALTSASLTTPTIDGFSAGHVAVLNSAGTNFGTALGTQTLESSVPATGTVFVAIQAVQTVVGAGCTNVTNSVQPTLFFTAPGGTAESYGPVSVGISISGNGVIDTGDAPSLSAPQQIIAKAGTSITYTTTSTLASTGCSTVPQYTIYAKATF